MTAVPVSGLVPLVPGAGPCQPTSAAAAQLQGNMAAVAAAAAMAPSTNPLINYQGYFCQNAASLNPTVTLANY